MFSFLFFFPFPLFLSRSPEKIHLGRRHQAAGRLGMLRNVLPRLAVSLALTLPAGLTPASISTDASRGGASREYLRLTALVAVEPSSLVTYVLIMMMMMVVPAGHYSSTGKWASPSSKYLTPHGRRGHPKTWRRGPTCLLCCPARTVRQGASRDPSSRCLFGLTRSQNLNVASLAGTDRGELMLTMVSAL